MPAQDGNISTFGTFLDRDTGNLFDKNNGLRYARNAIYKSETGDAGYVSNEPSNTLCVEIEYGDGKPVRIVGAIFLYDDYWAIFSTQNQQPTDGLLNEIGIFDFSRCEYVPVVRDRCFQFSPLFPIRGIRHFTPENVSVVFADGYNFDKILKLGPPAAWYKDAVSRGNVTSLPWLPQFDVIPYLFYDGNPSDDCVQREYCQPLRVNCEALKLNPRVTPITVTCKQSDIGGSLPNGLYYAAVAYSVNGQRYGNYFISPLAHVFTVNGTGSVVVTIHDADNTIFNEIELVIISQVNNNLTAKVIGYYSIETRNVEVTFIAPDLPVMDPSDVFRNISIYDVSEGIFEITGHAVRVAPKPKYDFNYQPLANLIRVEWGSVEYPADYYHKVTKNTSTSVYDVSADAVSFMRDELYTFYIRWVFDTGDRSPLFHIPAPPVKEMRTCPETNDIQFTSVMYSFTNTSEKVQDGGNLIAYGYTGTFLSSEKYDCNHPERWNYTHFRNNVLSQSKVCKNLTLPFPYPGTTDTDYDLCCKPIRLVHFPSEDIFPSALQLYNKSNDTVRYLGVRFSNIIHPFDNQGRPIQNIVGYEILRAAREGNKTIIAKGLLEHTCDYDPRDELNQTNKTSLFANFPYDPMPEYGAFSHPFISRKRLNLRYSIINSLPYVHLSRPCTTFIDKLYSYDNALFPQNYLYQVNLTSGSYNRHYVFRSPETSFGKPYANWDRIKVYGEYLGKMRPLYYTPDRFPRYKILSPYAYWQINIRAFVNTLLTLNGTIKVTFGNNAMSGNSVTVGGDAFGIATAIGIVILALSAVAAVNNLTFTSVLFKLLANPYALYGMNAYGMTPMSYLTIYEEQMAAISFLTSILKSGSYNPPKVDVTPGLLDSFPAPVRYIMYIPLFLSTFSNSLHDLENILKTSVPFHDYALQIASHGFYDTFSKYSGCNVYKIEDSAYIGRHLHTFKNMRVNNLYRTPYVMIKTQQKINNKINNDYSLEVRVRCNCCDAKSNTRPRDALYENLRLCSERITNNISGRYASLKIKNTRPYGQLFETKNILMGFTVPVADTDCDIKDQACRCDYDTYILKPARCNTRYTSPWMLYGDVYVTRYTEKDTFLFFYDYPAPGMPDGFDYDFLKRRNILYPRFWISTQTVDFLSSIYENDDISGKLCITCSPNFMDVGSYPFCVGGGCPNGINDFMSSVFGIQVNTNAASALANVICGIQNFFQSINNSLSSAMMNLVQSAISTINAGQSMASQSCNNLLDCLQKIFGIIIMWIGYQFLIVSIVVSGMVSFITVMVSVIGNVILAVTNLVGVFINIITTVLYDLNSGYIKNMMIPYNLDGCISSKCKDHSTGRERFIFYGMFGMWFYLGISSVRDFYVESEYNMAFRLSGEQIYEIPFSVYGNSNLYDHFSVLHLKSGDSFLYDNTLMASRQFLSLAGMGFLQPRSYNPAIIDYIADINRFRLIYSLPGRYNIYLPNNYKDFDDDITGLKNINDTGAIVLFRHRAPVYFAGVDTLTTDLSVKVNIGDGVLFQQAQRNATNTDVFYQYGSCQSPFAIVNSPYGIYFISNSNGKVFLYENSLQDISLSDMSRWFNTYLPFRINKYFPDFPVQDNSLDGIGSLVIYDGKYDLVYFCKRDYALKPEVEEKIKNGQLSIKYFDNYQPFPAHAILYHKTFVVYDGLGNVIEYFAVGSDRMKSYFDDVSFTISYSPLLRRFVSFHDWHPDMGCGSNNGFFTVNGGSIWKHNHACDSFCNFYGVQYPFELEFETDIGANVTVIRSLEFNVEVRSYDSDCNGFHHNLDTFFDRIVVYNSEQCTGNLDLILKPKNNPVLALSYPQVTLQPSMEILYEKSEQKYRVNQFWDIVRDRGEYSGVENIFIRYEQNGYVRYLDNTALDYYKPYTEHKRIRHLANKIWLIKNYEKGDGDRKIVVYLSNIKNVISIR